MAIIVSNNGGGSFTPHPEGPFATTCADVHDLGMVEVTWQGTTKNQHKIDIYFYCGETVEKEYDGEKRTVPLLVRSRFTATLDDRGRLRPFLESWRGKKFTPEEEKAFDLETLILAPAFIQVSHNEVNGKTYANIDAIMRMPKGMTQPDLPADFKRVKDRPPREEQRQPVGAGAPASHAAPSYEDFDPHAPFSNEAEDDLPF